MIYGTRANKKNYLGIKFDSEEECECFKLILKGYSLSQINVHKNFKLTDYPIPFKINLDFETPDFYAEYKGYWAFTNNALKHGLKTKYLWFSSVYKDKPFYLVVKSKKPPSIKGIKVVKLKTFLSIILNHANLSKKLRSEN